MHHLEEGAMSQTGAKTRNSDADGASNAAEGYLRTIIDTIPTIVWRKLPDGSADFLNQHFREYTGLSSEDGLGWGWMNAFHPDDRLMEEWRVALAAGKPFQKEARLRRADGEYRWFLIRAAPLQDEQGNIIKWYGLTCDIEDRKQAEDRIRLIIDTIPTMAWSVRPDGAVDFVNQRWLDYTGLSLEEEIEEPTRVVHPEDLPRVMEKWLADMAAGEPSEDEMRLRRADGEYRWFLVRTAPLRDEKGNIVKWYGSSIDIEDRKRAEMEARTLIEAIPQQIWSGPPDGTLDYCNDRWRSYMGLGLKELRGDGWQSMLHPDDRERVLKAWHESVTSGTPYEQEERHRRADGTYRWFLARGVPLRNAEGRIVRWYGTNTDIEDRQRAEEALRRSEERYRLIVENQTEFIVKWLPDGTRTFVNENYCRTFGIPEADCLGTSFYPLVDPEFREGIERKIAALTPGKPVFTEEHPSFLPDGQHWQQWMTRGIFDAGGNLIELLSAGRDITQLKRAEEELRQLSVSLLRSQDEERRRIARDLHDSMGQDLVALATILGQLRASIPSAKRKSRQLLSECKVLADKCIRDVRTLSYVLHPPVLDEAGLGEAIRDYVDGFTKRSGIHVELEVPPHVGRLARDIELVLFRVVQESLTNIQRHSGSQQAKIRVNRNSHLTLEISDLGRGLSATKQRGKEEARFEVGVGIPSMQERVKLIGGRLEIDSNNHGTTVHVTIPLERNEREKAAHSGG
jgi:PAS domain S-box-containing protein